MSSFCCLSSSVPPTGAAPVAAPDAPLANALRISQVYGGGGNSGATYTNDFVELFNSGSTPISLSSYSIQYASATGNSWNDKLNLLGSIGPGKYFLIQLAGGATGSSLPTPDQTGTINMSGSAGKVALVGSQTQLPAQTCPDPIANNILDFVGYGSTANCFEGSSYAPGLTNSTADLRAGNGCTDTDSNSADFTAGAPNPRNGASATNTCSVADTPPQVSSTTPAKDATGVAVNASITLNFSEIVDAGVNAFTLDCPAGTPGTPVTFTSNPTLPASDTSSMVLTPIGQPAQWHDLHRYGGRGRNHRQ